MNKLNSVKVLFEDESNNYHTSVSAEITKESAEKYFVGTVFDLGSYPKEVYRKCIGIEFTDNNKPFGKMTLLKVAMIRQPGYEIGKPAPMYLNCPCAGKPATDMETKENVLCSCGMIYTYNGYVIE